MVFLEPFNSTLKIQVFDKYLSKRSKYLLLKYYLHPLSTFFILILYVFPIFRVELNGSRNTTVQSQRYVNDLEAQRKQLEARLHAEAENHKHYINTLQGQIQYHATRAQGLQVSLDSVQQQVQQQVKIISKNAKIRTDFVRKY